MAKPMRMRIKRSIVDFKLSSGRKIGSLKLNQIYEIKGKVGVFRL